MFVVDACQPVKMFVNVVDACRPVKMFVNQEEACHAVKDIQEACRAALYSQDPSTSPGKLRKAGRRLRDV